ncbi:nucleotide exchange factor GrpE [Mycoplasma tauri]|uniref:nucleotide exchange factor GrpE n=1 Tax=Mycoplasma tauri TaxID=547987 RepID=UPI001CBE09B8|nr:nucleotide exchange factor GrpE [Mycoplasma tauri]MBZ4227051.1 nucleotide exchange factor GrpE [Mycoplasma tauri]
MVSNANKNILKNGNIIVADINVYDSNSKLDKTLSVSNFNLELGKDKFLPGFDKNLLGQKKKNNYKFSIHFPKNYKVEKYRNRSYEFILNIKSFTESINDENDYKTDINDKKSNNFKSKSGNFEQENKLNKKNRKNSKLVEKLIKEKEKILQEVEKSKILISDLEQKLELEKQAPKALVIPNELKKEVEQYAMQKFFEEFVTYYNFYKVTTERICIESEMSDDAKLKSLAKGYRMISWQFDELFKKYGLFELKPIEGDAFDPTFQKVNDQFIDDQLPTNTIINVHSPAFKLHDRVIQVALVDTTLKSDDPQAKKIIEKCGDKAYHLTPGKIHTLEEKIKNNLSNKD